MTPIGIVIPAYNSARFISRTLESLRAQTCPHWHCVIVDDGSTDQTAAIVESACQTDPRFEFIRQANAGVSAARTRGFAALPTQTTHVTFMDNDDLWLPEALQTLVDACHADPAAIGAHGLAELIDENDQPLNPGTFSDFGKRRLGVSGKRIIIWPLDEPTSFQTLVIHNPAYPPGVALIRKEIYDRVGPWDASFAAVQDWDMLIRLSRHGPIHFLPRVIIHYRRHAGNESNRTHRNIVEIRRLHHKTFFSPENSPAQARIAQEAWKAIQVMKIGEKSAAARHSLLHGRIFDSAKSSAHVGAHLIRWLRGRPRPTGI